MRVQSDNFNHEIDGLLLTISYSEYILEYEVVKYYLSCSEK